MIRFFVGSEAIHNGTIQLSAEDAEHIRALRLRPSELFIVCDGAGSDYICRLMEKQEDGLRQGDGSLVFWREDKRTVPLSQTVPLSRAEIVETYTSRGEPTVHCSVYIAHSKGDRLEYAVQKSVEVGAYNIVLFPSERCVSTPGDVSKKTARLNRISLETAKQCGRGRIPEVTAVNSFEEAIEQAARAIVPLFLYEDEENYHIKQALEDKGTVLLSSGEKTREPSPCHKTVSIVTGPEGGFEPHEAEYARSAGMHAVTLGPRILRCETAPVAALTAVMYHTGNL